MERGRGPLRGVGGDERLVADVGCVESGGVDDFLIDDNRKFHAHLNAINVPHEYTEYPGAHTWDYWDEHVQDAIAFHKKALKF